MHASPEKGPLPLAPILPSALRHVARPFEPALRRLLVPGEVLHILDTAPSSVSGGRFAQQLLDRLNIRFETDERGLSRLPGKDAAIVVANHPYGIVEGLILMIVVDRIRNDGKILANSILAGVDELRPKMILVDPFERQVHSEFAVLAQFRLSREGVYLLRKQPPVSWRFNRLARSPMDRTNWGHAKSLSPVGKEKCPRPQVFRLADAASG